MFEGDGEIDNFEDGADFEALLCDNILVLRVS